MGRVTMELSRPSAGVIPRGQTEDWAEWRRRVDRVELTPERWSQLGMCWSGVLASQ